MTTLTPAPGTPDAAGCAPRHSSSDHAIGSDAADAVSAALKALADPLRLRMLSAVVTAPDGQACVCDLAELTDVSQPTVSHHLKVLRDVGILTSQRRGTWVWYRVAPGYRGAVTTLLDRFAPAALAVGSGADTRRTAMGGLTDVDPALDRLVDSLAGRHPGVPADQVRRTVRESYTGLARRGGMPLHLVALTEHFAGQRLADLERAAAAERAQHDDGTAAAHPPQVLFVCVGNAGRSQLAAALLHRYAGTRVVVRSAGSMPVGDVHDTVRPLLAELGADGEEVFPKPLTDDAVRAADVVVTMGCGDACPVLPGKRYEDWVVGDPALASPQGARAIRDEIDRRVRALLADFLPDLDLPR